MYLLDEDTFFKLSKEPVRIDCEEFPDVFITAFLEAVLVTLGKLILTDVGIFIDLLTDGKYVVKTW